MKRVREIQYQDLRSRLDSRALQGLFFVHLKKGLATQPLDWIGCEAPSPPSMSTGTTTAYGVDCDLQRKLAAMRTDLDSFTEVEAYALMLSGYLMTEHQFENLQRQHEKERQPGTWGDFDVHAPRGDWPFMDLEPLFGLPPDSQDSRRQDLGKQLEVSASRLFKVWKLIPALHRASWVTGAAGALLLITLIWAYWETPMFHPSMTVGRSLLLLVLAMATLLVPVLKWLNPEGARHGYLRKTLIAVVGFIVAKAHLRFFDRLFLERGRLTRLLGLKRPSS